jgi:hypothetical protein
MLCCVLQEELQRNLDRVVDLFSIVFTGGDVQRARELLSRNLREHIKVCNAGGARAGESPWLPGCA